MTHFSLIAPSKLEQTPSTGAFNQFSASQFTPEVLISTKIGSVCKHIFLHPFVLQVVKAAEFWVCKLPKALLLVANEQILHSPKPPKDLFLQNFIQSFNHPFTYLLLSFQYFFNLHRVWKINNIMGCLGIMKDYCCLYQGFQHKVSLGVRV